MFDNFKIYFKDRINAILIYILALIIVLVINKLYWISNDGVIYSAILTTVIIILIGVYDYLRYNYNINVLKKCLDDLTLDINTKKTNNMDKYYEELILGLKKEINEINNKHYLEKNELYEDYIIWIHQIKTPIASLFMMCDEVEGELGADLTHEVFRVDRYTDMALNNIRLQSISTDLEIGRYNISDLVKEVLKDYSIQFNYKKNKLILKDIDKVILTDKKWFMFIFEQILSNAIKYTNNGEITIGIEKNYLIVEDTGIGIKPEDVKKLFSRGFTGFTGRENRKATGLGLYMSKKIGDSLGHSLFVKSEMGKGTKVYICVSNCELNKILD